MSKPNPDTPLQLFVTCIVDAYFPQVGMSVVEILERQGYTVEFPYDQTCCGQPAFNGGFWDDARAMARHNLDLLSSTQGPIIIPSGSCADMMIHKYPLLFADEPAYAAKAQTVAQRTREFTQFLVEDLGLTNLGAAGEQHVTYHHSCHGLRGLGIKGQPEALLNDVEGLQRTSLPHHEECCGFGGLFAIKMADISGAMLNKKLDYIESTGADYVVGGDVSCLLNIGGGLAKRGSHIQVKHIAEVLNQGEERA